MSTVGVSQFLSYKIIHFCQGFYIHWFTIAKVSENVKSLPTVPNRRMYLAILLVLAVGLFGAGFVFPFGMVIFPCFPIYPLAVYLESQNRRCDAPTVYETVFFMCINAFHIIQLGSVGLAICVIVFANYLVPLWHLNFGRYAKMKTTFLHNAYPFALIKISILVFKRKHGCPYWFPVILYLFNRKLLHQGKLTEAKKVYRELQIYQRVFNNNNRCFRIPFFFFMFDAIMTFTGFSLIAHHNTLEFFSLIILLILLVFSFMAFSLFKFMELFESTCEDFSRELKGQCMMLRNGDPQFSSETLKFVQSLMPLRIYRLDTYVQQGLSLSVVDTNINNIIFLLV